jgi:hypothetical protein
MRTLRVPIHGSGHAQARILLAAASLLLTIPNARAARTADAPAKPASSTRQMAPAPVTSPHGTPSPIGQLAHARLPIVFTANQGQAPAGTLYEAQGAGLDVLLGKTAVTLLHQIPHPAAAQSGSSPAKAIAAGTAMGPAATPGTFTVDRQTIEFVGENPDVVVEPLDRQPGKASYFRGQDPSRWTSNLSTFARVRYRNLYPGIDLIFYSRNGRLEYDFTVAAGANPELIRMRINGGDPIHFTEDGALQVGSGAEAILHRPMLYQNMANGKKMVEGQFTRIDNDTVGFNFAGYDKSKTLVIDPAINLVYSTYMGGQHDDVSYGISVDAAGNAYITGYSASQDFPVTGNAFQTTRMDIGTYTYDVVVMKFDPSGTLLYSTFLGGSQTDQGLAIVVDPSGNAWVGGSTYSSDFPVTSSAFQKTFGGGKDGFLAEISPDGSSLLYSTYLGGAGDEYIGALILNADGSLWMSGGASAAGLPVSANAAQSKPNGVDNYFVAKATFNKAGAMQVPYLTFIGGSNNNEEAFWGSLAVDSTGNVYLAGGTQSGDFPVTTNAYQKPFPLSDGCYAGTTPNSIPTLTKFSPDLSQMLYSTVIGGKIEALGGGEPDCNQFALSIHLDAQQDIWLTGTTGMSDFPVTSNAISKQLGTNGQAGVDDFVIEMSPDGTKELYGTFIGGTAYDYAGRAVWDSNNNIWLSGTSASTDFPVTSNALQKANDGGFDATLTELSPDGTKILYSTYLGGSGDDNVDGSGTVAIDLAGNIHLAGETTSANFPVTATAFQSIFANGDAGADSADIFYTVLGSGIIGAVGPVVGGDTGDTTITITGAGFQAGATCDLVEGTTTIAAAHVAISSNGTSMTCTFALNGATTGSYNVVVSNPDGTTFTQNNAFTVEAGQGPNIWMNLVGRSAVRFNTPTTFTVSYGNSGNTDAIGVPIFITVPGGITGNLSTAVPPVPTLSDFDPRTLPTSYTVSGNTVIPLFIPRLAPGQSGSMQFQITVPSTVTNFTLQAYNWAPFAASVSDFVAAFPPASQPQVIAPFHRPRILASGGGVNLDPNAASKCIQDLIQLGLQIAQQVVPGSACATSAAGFIGNAVQTLISANQPDFSASDAGSSLGQLYAGAGQAALNCALAAEGATPVGMAVNTALALIQASLQGASAAADCSQAAQPQNPQGQKGGGVGAIDPNDKTGPSGDGSKSQYIAGGKALTYNLAFENKPTATAPASQVVVTDQLDPSKVNLASVSLGAFNFGSTVINPPSGVSSFNTLYSINSSLSVRIQGGVDTQSGLMKWTFTSIDPSTGLPPSDPTVGFLPPDTDGIKGQGSVLFAALPMSSLTTGTAISNTAQVVFDSNAAIDTPTWTNTMDVDPPKSAVTALPASTTQTSFTVSWSGTDAGSGIASYDIYVSEDSGAFTLWQSAVTTTSASYAGAVGHTYGFLSEATDKVGNVEVTKTTADTTTQIVTAQPADFTVKPGSSALSVSAGASGDVTIDVTPENGFNQAVTFSCSGLPAKSSCGFSPASVTPSGSTASTTTLTITTTGTTAHNAPPFPWTTGSLATALVLLPFFYRKRRTAWLIVFVCAAGIAMSLTGCGGSSTPPSVPGTPAGTSTITVTATSGSGASALTHTTTITLTVQ